MIRAVSHVGPGDPQPIIRGPKEVTGDLLIGGEGLVSHRFEEDVDLLDFGSWRELLWV